MHPCVHIVVKYLRKQKKKKQLKAILYIASMTLINNHFKDVSKKKQKKFLARLEKKKARYTEGKWAGVKKTALLIHLIEELNEYMEKGNWKEAADILSIVSFFIVIDDLIQPK